VLIRVQELRRRKLPFDTTLRPGAIDLTETKYRLDAPLRVLGFAELIGGTDEIRVNGRIKGAVAGECDRCLDPVRFEYDEAFELNYREAPKGGTESEVEIDDEEAEIGYYEGEGVRLEDVAGEQLLLWLPMQCVCSEECKGICPVCGANRNKTSCDCHEKPVDERWAALRDIHVTTRS
jgi:uncharacterized protein